MKNKQQKFIRILVIIIGATLIFVGLASIITAVIWQQILIYQKYGVLFDGDGFNIFIPHWSTCYYLGIIPLLVGYLIIYFKRSKK